MDLIDELVGRDLVAVERLTWTGAADSPADRRTGPVHLRFDNGQGVLLSGGADKRLSLRPTTGSDESWLAPYAEGLAAGTWVRWAADDEPPFDEVLGDTLTAIERVPDQAGEAAGVVLRFDDVAIIIDMDHGEVRTPAGLHVRPDSF